MPVLVNAAHRPVPGMLVARLLAGGGQVRALARDGVAALRASGVFTAVGDPDDEGLLEAACTGVHTLVHLCGGLGGDPAAVLAEGRAVAAAAEGAGIRRLLLVTLAGAASDAADPLRRAHAAVSDLVATADVPSVEVRVGLVDTPAVRGRLRAAGPPPELLAVRPRPVPADELVGILVALDAARARATAGHLVIAATGPATTLGELLAADPGDGGGVLGARLPTAAAREAILATLAGPWEESDPSVPAAHDLLGAPSAPQPDGGPA